MEYNELLNSPVFKLITQASDDLYIYLADFDHDTSRWSKAAVEQFGLPGEFIENTAEVWSEYIHPDDRPVFQADMERLFKGESNRHNCEYRARTASGEYVWVRCSGLVSRGENGSGDIFAGAITTLGRAAKFDSVTGLPGYQEFYSCLDGMLDAEKTGAVLLFGVDNFKRINDVLGYAEGDRMLYFAAQEIRTAAEKASCFRLDGDKIACILPECTDTYIDWIFSNLRQSLSSFPDISSTNIQLSISCGVARFPEDGRAVGVLRAEAEHALEQAKQSRKGSLSYYSHSLHQKSLANFRIQESLRQAILHQFSGFSLQYQPLIREKDNSVFGAEALLRFSSPDLPPVSPAEFIPILESTGAINEVGAWVLRTALAQVAEWRRTIPDFCISVNISYIQIRQPEFRGIVMSALEESGVSPDGLILELTESCKISELSQLQQDFAFFAEHNIKMALDDFGTGYSSIAVLRDLEPPLIKIDHTFVSSITEKQFDEAIIEYILQLCQRAGIQVCVEGIESTDSLRIVQRYHPQLLQGYYFSRPLAAETFAAAYITPKQTNSPR